MIRGCESVYRGLLEQGLGFEAHPEQVAYVVASLFPLHQLEQMAKVQSPERLKMAIAEVLHRRIVFRIKPTQAAQDRRIQKWLESQSLLSQVNTPQEVLDNERALSLMLSSWPGQEDSSAGGLSCAQLQLRGTALLYAYFEGKTSLDAWTIGELFAVERVLFVHSALFGVDGHEISWMQLISEWASGDGSRKALWDALRNRFQKLHNPYEESDDHGIDLNREASLQSYVQNRTLQVIARRFDVEFEKKVVLSKLQEFMRLGEKARLDLVYFTKGPERMQHLLSYIESGVRYHVPVLEYFYSFFDLNFLCDSREQRSYLLHTIFCAVARRQALFPLKDTVHHVPLTTALHHIGSFLEKLEQLYSSTERLYLILCYYKHRAALCRVASTAYDLATLNVFELLALIDRHPDRVEHLNPELDGEFITWAHQLAEFNRDQLMWLQCLHGDSLFIESYVFLQKVFSLVGKKSVDLAFHFLINAFQMKSALQKKILDDLQDFSGMIEEKQQEIAGEIVNAISQTCFKPHLNEIAALFSQFLLDHQESLKADNSSDPLD